MSFISRYSTSLKRKRRKRRKSDPQTEIQTLEPRRLLAADIGFNPDTGIVNIDGTSLDETSLVTRSKEKLFVNLQNSNSKIEKVFALRNVNGLVFTGRGGNDRFDNRSGIGATAYGNNGSDILIGGWGVDNLYGGNDDDVIVGRGGDDLMFGNKGNDRMYGQNGNDDLRGGAGNDLLAGAYGEDVLRGGGDDDSLFGGNGNDILRGDAGNDLLLGQMGDDDLHGWDGADDMRGGRGNDILRGGADNDTMRGGDDDDIVLGEAGDDDLFGNGGDDLLIGGTEVDMLRGQEGSDILIGGTTDYDPNNTKLNTILDAWTSAENYQAGVDLIFDREFEFFLRSSETVFDDLAVDTLAGSVDLDWYFDPGSGHHHGEEIHVPDQLKGVQDQEVVDVTLPHAGDPVRQANHFLAMALVPYDIITHTAVQSGNWSDPATWADGVLPDAGANVLISKDVTVTVDGVFENENHGVRVDGTLQFATDVDTKLRVETMLLSMHGHLKIGTADNPVQPGVTAELSIIGTPIDRGFDPTAMGHGLMSHGTVEMYGQEKTAYSTLAKNAGKNKTTLTLANVPTDWAVGDQVVLAGTSRNAKQDELLQIVAIDGDKITVDRPLAYWHSGTAGKAADVANLTRNVQVRSENPDDISQRGHVMFMHSPNVDVNHAGFYELGRSDKTTPLHDSVLDDDGNLVPGTGTNQRGRYAVHFHRHGVENTGNPATVRGAVVVGSPGWGYVNHSSFVEVTDSVAYDVVGASFVTEAGDEIGTFSGNIAIRGEGSGDGINHRKDVQDFGHQGDGFWLQGPGVGVYNNVASGQRGQGFVFFTRGLIENGKTTMFLSENLDDPSIANGKAKISVANVPLHGFSNNVAYGNKIGAKTQFHLLNAKHDQQSTIENLETWNNGQGLSIPYTNQTTVRNVRAIGNLNNPTGVGINRNNVTRNITFENLHVEGYDIGLYMPRRGNITVVGGYFNNLRNFYIQTAVKPDRTVLITGDVQFGYLSDAALRGRKPYRVVMQHNFYPFQDKVEHVFYSDQVTLDFAEFTTQRLYYEAQTMDFVPFPEKGEFIPEPYVGKTNKMLFEKFGLTVGGEFAPADATKASGIKGLLG